MQTLRHIPSVDHLLQRPGIRALARQYGREATVDALRHETTELRRQLSAHVSPRGEPAAESDELAARIEASVAARLGASFAPTLFAVINATGVIVHTNLGRAPLAAAAAARVAAVAQGYSNLEYDLDAGRRGARDAHAEALLVRLTGAEAAVVANNNAAATLLILAALAYGREVVISRGELVEIGGGFRIPDVLHESGAILREVGTTNRTRAADYASAVNDRTGLILRVHQSNFRIEGFTERPRLEELVAIGRQLGVTVVEDLGSGNLLDTQLSDAATTPAGQALANRLRQWEEPSVRDSLAAGADVVSFSGDKLLGGPQAGIVAGRRDLIQRIRRHPLMRAMRVDKMTYAALEATLLEYAHGRALETVPVARAMALPAETVQQRAHAIAERLRRVARLALEIVPGQSAIGGGSTPGATLPTFLLAVRVEGASADRLEARLRARTPPVIGRIHEDRVVLDLRTVMPEQDDRVAEALQSLVAEP